MIWPWPGLDLTWAQTLKLTFQVEKVGTCFEPAWRGKHDGAFFVSSIQKILMKNYLREKRQLFIWWPLEPKLLTLGQIWSEDVSGAWEELPNVFFEFFLAIILLEIIAIVCKKSTFSRKLTSGDLWWPLYWPDFKMTCLKVWDLLAVYLMPFTACR